MGGRAQKQCALHFYFYSGPLLLFAYLDPDQDWYSFSQSLDPFESNLASKPSTFSLWSFIDFAPNRWKLKRIGAGKVRYVAVIIHWSVACIMTV